MMKLPFFLGISSLVMAAPRIEVQGHRGARGLRPENTLPAFDFALAAGVDTLELDIAVSSDGVLMISHEPMLSPERCLAPGGKKLAAPIPIRSLPAAEIAKYDCGSLPHPKFPDQKLIPGTPMPRLEDLFAMVRDSKLPAAKAVQFNIETKIYSARPDLTPPPAEFAQQILLLAEKFGFLDRITLQSFDDRALLAAKKFRPKVRTIMLTADNHVDYVAVMKACRADVLSPNHEWILPADVKALHARGLRVVPWTAETENDWRRLIDMRVDGIITDYPDRLIAYLKKQGLR